MIVEYLIWLAIVCVFLKPLLLPVPKGKEKNEAIWSKWGK